MSNRPSEPSQFTTSLHKRTVKLVQSSYQPTKAELEKPIKLNLPEGTTPEQIANALLRPVNIKWMDKPKR